MLFRSSLWTWGPRGDVSIATGDDGAFLALSGYLTAVQGGPSFREQSDAAQFLFKAFDARLGFDQLRDLLGRAHGSFSALYRCPAEDTMVCVTDRVASRPMWTFRKAGLAAVSTHASAIAAALRLTHFDKGALASLLLYGGPVEPRRSMFEGVAGIGAGSIMDTRKGAEPTDRKSVV